MTTVPESPEESPYIPSCRILPEIAPPPTGERHWAAWEDITPSSRPANEWILPRTHPSVKKMETRRHHVERVCSGSSKKDACGRAAGAGCPAIELEAFYGVIPRSERLCFDVLSLG